MKLTDFSDTGTGLQAISYLAYSFNNSFYSRIKAYPVINSETTVFIIKTMP